MSVEKEYGCYIPTCDYCGSHLSDCTSYDEAIKAFRLNGWKARKEDGEWKNICTDCLEWESGYDD